MTTTSTRSTDTFIARWLASSAAERANFQMFANELCELLEVERPHPSTGVDAENAYVFERSVTFHNPDGSTSVGRIDLYKRGCFVMEGKQGSDGEDVAAEPLSKYRTTGKRGTARRGTKGWDDAMIAAHGQAIQYVQALPVEEGNPPFVVVVDVGHSIELYSDFSRSGKSYVPFPDPVSHRIRMEDLRNEGIRERLRLLWEDPMSLDPSRRSARVTREVADRLARLARSLEGSGYDPERASQFLMRCIFTMFAEDVKLIPERAFTTLLEELLEDVAAFPDALGTLWGEMNRGGFSGILRKKLLRFNGGLFEDVEALPLTKEQLSLLIDASKADWHDVEPAIFGTLVERALDPIERHKLGAHYTPRAYVERLVMPTIVEPLREEWDAVRAAAVVHMNAGRRSEAIDELRTFHRRLCTTTILDPACGTGNFLYVTLEHLKRLEGEVRDLMGQVGEASQTLELTELTVDPHQLLGIEINPRAAAIADLVLWIGYLQWHFRSHGDALPREPVLHNYHNIDCRDALLAYDGVHVKLDEQGHPITRWDGRTMKNHPVTGEEVPDEAARVEVVEYENPRKAEWPEAEFIVGNPPFVGAGTMRSALGEGYTETVRNVYAELPESIDFVMYWWDRAAEAVRKGSARRFGFITTNSLRQTFNRRVLARHMEASSPVAIDFAIPDHPWVDSSSGADVRIAMTVVSLGTHPGKLQLVVREDPTDGEALAVAFRTEVGQVNSDLTTGRDVASVEPLASNGRVSSRGVSLHGAGFILRKSEAVALGCDVNPAVAEVIREYRNGRDLASHSRNVFVIDLFGLEEEEVRTRFPEIYQLVYERVKPERDQNNRDTYRRNWWIFGEPRSSFRPALQGLPRYIATVETSKHRFFVFLDATILPDNMLVNIAHDDAYVLGVLSSVVHVKWALATGGRLGVGNDPRYNKTRCFETFPFPAADDAVKGRVRDLAEQLDAHRKRQQELHPKLTMTEMYNVLEKLRSGETLTAKEKRIHEEGLVSVLKELHDDLDRAVLEAYGWEELIPLLAWERREEFDAEILERLVDLNHERAEEEKRGLVRWLRPEFQAPAETQAALGLAASARAKKPNVEARAAAPTSREEKLPWPKTLKEQTQAVRAIVASATSVLRPDDVARRFRGARVDRVAEVLETLAALGAVREVDEGRFVR